MHQGDSLAGIELSRLIEDSDGQYILAVWNVLSVLLRALQSSGISRTSLLPSMFEKSSNRWLCFDGAGSQLTLPASV